MSIRSRLEKLEEQRREADACPHCRPIAFIMDGEETPVCSQCSRPPAKVVRIVEVVVGDDPTEGERS